MTYRVQAYEGLKGTAARLRWRVGLTLADDGHTFWGPWQSTGYTKSESVECEAYKRVKALADALDVEPEFETPMRED